MARDKRRSDPAVNDEMIDEMAPAGHASGVEKPSATGTAGIYATPVHEEGREAEAEGERRAEHSPH